jgi:hypothetical protein
MKWYKVLNESINYFIKSQFILKELTHNCYSLSLLKANFSNVFFSVESKYEIGYDLTLIVLALDPW